MEQQKMQTTGMLSDNLQKVLSEMGQLHQSLNSLDNESFGHLPESRMLKVQPMFRERVDEPHHIVPGLHLSGKWLHQAGFTHRRYARILSIKGMLVICPEKEP